jgi:hypothetical protein
MNKAVNLADHWLYQVLKYQFSNKANLLSQSLLALQNPWGHRLILKLKMVDLLWLQRCNIQKFSKGLIPK